MLPGYQSSKKIRAFPFLAIPTIFQAIPKKKILQLARQIQTALHQKKIVANKKKNQEWITPADSAIQHLILQYFATSPLAGTYLIHAEEQFHPVETASTKTWILLVDPLDGTSAFLQGKETWGVMVGACNLAGILQYAWCLVSSGQVFTTTTSSIIKKSFSQKLKDNKKIMLDVYDYEAGVSEKFGPAFEKVFDITHSQYSQTSYPSALWAGWQLYQEKLDGLLWLPSKQGKKWYPGYDLIFLGTLATQGFSIMLGKKEKFNALIAVAPQPDVEKLYKLGLTLLPKNMGKQIKKSTHPLQII